MTLHGYDLLNNDLADRLSGLFWKGTVTAVPGANQFTIPTLAGLGDGLFADAVAPYQAFVLRDAAGLSAAPQGEQQAVTAYDSDTGAFTANAFTVAVAVGDKIMIIHPSLASAVAIIADLTALLADVGDASASTLGSLYAILGNPAQTYLAMIGYEGAASLADKLTAARAALIDEITALRLAELDAANLPSDIDAINTKLGTNVDAAGTTTVFARLAQIVTTYLADGTIGLAALEALVDDLETAVGAIEGATTLHNKLTVARAGYLDELAAANLPTDVANVQADTEPKVMGRTQIAATTIDLNQAAASYDLFTGTTEAVILESLNIKMPNLAGGGALTGISIQTARLQ